MARRPNKSIAEILSLSSTNLSSLDDDYIDKHIAIDKKIAVVTEGFTSYKFWELILKDRNRLSIENALKVCGINRFWIWDIEEHKRIEKDKRYTECSEDVTDSGMSSRGTEPRTEPLPIDQQWCLNCINQH
jgi:hypothetical protein